MYIYIYARLNRIYIVRLDRTTLLANSGNKTNIFLVRARLREMGDIHSLKFLHCQKVAILWRLTYTSPRFNFRPHGTLHQSYRVLLRHKIILSSDFQIEISTQNFCSLKFTHFLNQGHEFVFEDSSQLTRSLLALPLQLKNPRAERSNRQISASPKKQQLQFNSI